MELEEPEDARIMLSRAVECCPTSVEVSLKKKSEIKKLLLQAGSRALQAKGRVSSVSPHKVFSRSGKDMMNSGMCFFFFGVNCLVIITCLILVCNC